MLQIWYRTQQTTTQHQDLRIKTNVLFIKRLIIRMQASCLDDPNLTLRNRFQINARPKYLLHRMYSLYKLNKNVAEFEVLTAVSTKMSVSWVVAPCSLVEVYQRFRGPCCLHQPGDVAYNPEDSHQIKM
jgi:hypothetical protein